MPHSKSDIGEYSVRVTATTVKDSSVYSYTDVFTLTVEDSFLLAFSEAPEP